MATKYSINDMVKLARTREGRCLSSCYINNKTNLTWECKFKHVWPAKPAHILSGHWCPNCAGRHKTIAHLNEHAKSCGGVCLSLEYLGARTNHEWECKNGHRWFATPTNVLRGTWCGKCKGKYVTINDCQNLAKRHKGKCIDLNYVNSQHLMKWQCADGHIFKKGWSQIKAGAWCPNCTRFVSEEICRSFMEAVFNRKFLKVRPAWLLNEKGNRMELDGYNKSLKLAFEHNGEHHYEEGYFTKDLATRTKDDDKKSKLCQAHGINLVIFTNIPLKESTEKILDHLKSTLEDHHVTNVKSVADNIFSLESIKSPTNIRQFHQIAKRNNGVFLDEIYLGVDHEYNFICMLGHHFKKRGARIKEGAWCPQCAKNAAGSYNKVAAFALKKGGKLLSTSYQGALINLDWQCAKGHTFSQRPTNILTMGTWCPKCATNNPPNINEIAQLADARGGKLLSTTYVNSKTKLNWECRYGHQWPALYSNIKKGRWCPTCGGIESN